jgi:uncharacterized protein (DUF934 family)
MRQILRRRELSVDRWRYPGEAGDGPLVRTLPELLAAAGAEPPVAGELGVRIAPTDEVAQLAALVPRLALVVVQFERSGDGRGYSQGQMLRQRYGYAGELRAAGAVKRDQLFLLARCGFDAFDFDAAEDPRAALAHLQSFSVAYQRSAGSLVQPRLRN